MTKTDYYPFGMIMPGRKFTANNSYRYGFNGQERSTEIHENTTTAEFWQYDCRLGRRWNVDPVPKSYESPYIAFANNPINVIDPDGADTVDINKVTTITRIKGSSDGHSDHLVSHDRAIVTHSGSISITSAKGEDVFRIINTTVCFDEDGNRTSSSTTTTLELDNPQTFYRTGGHNVKGYIDDRYALAAHAPTWLLEYYDKKTGDIGIKSALVYQKEVPFVAGLGKIMDVAYTVSGAYGIFRLGLSKLAFQTAVKASVPDGSVYSVAFETKLPSNLYPGGSYYAHFKAANIMLDAQMAADKTFAAQIEALGIKIPKSSTGTIIGKSPANWVWHHSTETGIMQLVPKSQHPSIPGGIFWETMHPGGAGGNSIWNK